MSGETQVTTQQQVRVFENNRRHYSSHEGRRSGEERAHSDVDDLPPNMRVDVTQLEEIARYWLMTVLRNNRYSNLANQLPPVRDPDQDAHRLINSLCTRLETERAQQFDEIISSLSITSDSLEDTYRQLMTHVFQDSVNWGRVITFLVFSSRLSLHCAQSGMQNRVRDIVEWTEDEMRERIHGWVIERGGWASFVHHYDDDSWKMSLPSFLVVAGMFAAVFASGVFMAKRFLF
jgi:hypothetical protein